MKDLKSLYLSAKLSGNQKDISAYKEYVEDLFENHPSDYMSDVEYIIKSSLGLSTLKPFIEKHGLPIACYDTVLKHLETCVEKCLTDGLDPSEYSEMISYMESFREQYKHCFMMFESFVTDDDAYLMEKKTQEDYRINSFKKRYHYNPNDQTIVIDGQKIKIDLDIKNPFEQNKNKVRQTSMKYNHETGEITIVLDRAFFLKPRKRQDAILQHELGHVNLKYKNKDKTSKDRKAGIQAAKKYEIPGTHATADEFEADRYAANRTSAKDLKKALMQDYKHASKFKNARKDIQNQFKELNIDKKLLDSDLFKTILNDQFKRFKKDTEKDYNQRVKALKDPTLMKNRAYQKESYIEAYYGYNQKGIQNRKLMSGMLERFGECAIPDLFITADTMGDHAMNTLMEYIFWKYTSPELYQYVCECAKDTDKEIGCLPFIEMHTLEAVVNTMMKRNTAVFRESVLMEKDDAVLEYSEEELDALADLISFKEYQIVCTEDTDEAVVLQEEVYRLYEEFDGILTESGEVHDYIEPEGGRAEDTASMFHGAKPLEETSWVSNTHNKKTGGIPDYLARNHDLGYGEDESNEKPEEEKDELEDFRRPSAGEDPQETSIDDEYDKSDKSEYDTNRAINNYYYYNYTNSLNKNSNSFNKDNSIHDDHTKTSKIDNHSTNYDNSVKNNSHKINDDHSSKYDNSTRSSSNKTSNDNHNIKLSDDHSSNKNESDETLLSDNQVYDFIESSDYYLDKDSYDKHIKQIYFIKSDDNVDNCCISLSGYDKPMRGRSMMILLKNINGKWNALIKRNPDGEWEFPGGGWNKGEQPIDAAIRETQEEAQYNTKDVKRVGTQIEYNSNKNSVSLWVKNHVKNSDDWWYGYYSAIFIGKEDGEFTGHIDEEDYEDTFNWKPLKFIAKKFPADLINCIEKYIYESVITEDVGDVDDLKSKSDHPIKYDTNKNHSMHESTDFQREYVPITDEQKSSIIDRINTVVSNIKNEPILMKYNLYGWDVKIYDKDFESFFTVKDHGKIVPGILLYNGKPDIEIELMVVGSDQYDLKKLIEKDYPEDVERLSKIYDLNTRSAWSDIQWVEKLFGYDKTLDEITDELTNIINDKYTMIHNFEFGGDNDSGPIFSGIFDIDYIADGIDLNHNIRYGSLVMHESTDDIGGVDDLKPESDHPVKDRMMDLDRELVKKKQEAKKKIQDIQNAGRAVKKPVMRTKQWIGNMVGRWKDVQENNVKEKMADPRARKGLFNAITSAIKYGSLAKAGLLFNPIFLFLSLTRKCSMHSKEFRIRNEMIGEIKTELEILEEKIKDAENKKDMKAKYQMMRLKNELNKKLLRVGGEKDWNKLI